jgi:NAD(P)H-hydrate epimerase
MKRVTQDDLKRLFIPPSDSHKGQNGRLLIIGGSHLFHAASIWALEVASRIVDLVHYSSVSENNAVVLAVKKHFRDGIVIPREDVEDYIKEDDVILIGPGMTRDEETKTLTDTLLTTYPGKQWVIDAGALQMMEPGNIPKHAILTPHHGEFAALWERYGGKAMNDEDKVRTFARKHDCIVLLKGKADIASDGGNTMVIEGGNAGMTKGGTGDVLAGLIAALTCKNDPFLATTAGSYINKTAGDDLAKTVGIYFNASDLASQIPRTMKRLLAA